MAKKDYYSVLNLTKSASENELKKAYRKLAMQYHPDQNPGDKVAEEKFKEVSEAYEVLSNPEKRKMYDQFGHAGAHTGGAGGFHGNPFQSGGFDFGGFQGGQSYGGPGGQYSSQSAHDLFNDLFGDMFGQRRRGPAPQKGSDLKYTQKISFEEASTGCEKRIQFIRQRNGKQDTASLAVKIPSGVKQGQRLKLKGEGDTGVHGGPIGDLYVVIDILPHPLFKRIDNDLHMDLPISFVDAILGTNVEIPTLTGKANLKVPAGTQAGQSFRLKGKGFSDLKGLNTGDMLIKVVVDTAKNLNSKEKEALKKLSDLAQKAPLVQEFNAKMKQILNARK